MINILITLGIVLVFIVILLVYCPSRPIESSKEEPISGSFTVNIFIPKIKNGSKLTIGKDNHALTFMNVDQHFNWFQKKMWKLILGIKVEDYSEEN